MSNQVEYRLQMWYYENDKRHFYKEKLVLNTNLSYSVMTANIISLLLLGTLYFANKQRMSYERDMKIVQMMMAITAISNVADCCVFYISDAGIFSRIILYLSGSWLFLGNILIGYTWARFLTTHLSIPFSNTRKKVYMSGGLIGCILLIINLFYPLVFYYDENGYNRGPAYMVFLIFALLYILDSLYLYAECRKKAGTMKLFPVQVFLGPIAIGLIVQYLFLETAITWTSLAVSIAGVMTALKNEMIFLDRLTGLYNRVYLEFLQKQACRKKNVWVAGIMIDLNGFKQINDNYGHSEGDVALIIVADLLRKSFSEYGVVTRYAGDESVVMLNTTDEQFIQELIEHAKNNFTEENEKNDKPYQLSASMGYAISNLSDETIDDFMNRIDKEMYQDKLAYYESNDRRKK